MRAYNAAHKPQIAETNKKYAARRFFYFRAANLALRHPSAVVATLTDLANLWKRQHGRCAITDRRLDRHNSQLDHIIPIVRSGVGTIDNLRWVHRDVNYAKRDLSEQDFFKLCSDVIVANLRKQEI